MLHIHLNETDGIATLQPEGELTETDFRSAAQIIDPYIETFGRLHGIIIHVETIPGWESFKALMSHFTFVKDHHKQIACVALATDSMLGSFAETVASHFISAQVKHFAFDDIDAARDWIKSVAS